MEKLFYNKLVRDKIPSIIKKSGKNFKVSTISDDKFFNILLNKLQEEVDEFKSKPNIEEIGDIMTVILELMDTLNITYHQLYEEMSQKLLSNGEYKQKIFLEWVDK